MPVPCPYCQRKAIRQSTRRGMFEVTELSVIPMRPFRCEDYGQRCYGFVWPTDSMQSHSETSRSIVVRTVRPLPNRHRRSCTS